MAEPTSFHLTVSDVITETTDACTVTFEQDLPYKAGQFLTLRIPSDRCGPVARCYSLCSSPHVDASPRIAVKRTAGGYASNWICDNVRAGDTLEALAPAGIFAPRSLDSHLLLFAAGS